MATFDTTELLANVRRRAMVANASAGGTADADLLQILNEEMQSAVVPAIMRARSEYFVSFSDVTIVADTAAYDVPARAMGAKLREVQLVTSAGAVRNLPQLAIDELHLWNNSAATSPIGFYVRAGKVVLHPTPTTAAGTLRLWFYRRPNRLVAVSSCAVIVSAASAPTYTANPTVVTTSTLCDVVRAVPHFDSLSDDVTPSAVSNNVSITFSSSITGAAAGDYIAAAGTTCVPQLPAEWHPVLAQRAAARILQHKGSDEARGAWELAKAMAGDAVELIAPRVDGEPQFLVNEWWW